MATKTDFAVFLNGKYVVIPQKNQFDETFLIIGHTAFLWNSKKTSKYPHCPFLSGTLSGRTN